MHDSTNGPTQRYCRSWIQWFKELGVVLFRNCCRIKVRQRGGAATQDPTARRAATQDPTVRGEATQDPTARGELRPVIMEVRGGGVTSVTTGVMSVTVFLLRQKSTAHP